MNTQSQSSKSSDNSNAGFSRRFTSWLSLRRLLIAFGWMAALIALFYGVENWRGRRAWNEYRQQLEARGAQLDLRSYIPQPIPDDQNFAAIPLIKSWFPRGTNDDGQMLGTNYDQVSVLVAKQKTKDARRQLTDLVAWKEAFDAVRSGQTNRTIRSEQLDAESRAKAAPAVLDAIKSPQLDELRAASRRPLARYPVVYDMDNPWGILLPHLGKLRHITSRLQLEASAQLAAGQTDQAFETVKLMLYVNDTLKEEPILVSYLVRLVCFQMTTQAIWEGLAEHRWNEAQLKEMQTRILGYNFLEDAEKPLQGERAAGVLTVDIIRKNKKMAALLQVTNPGEEVSGIGWLDIFARIMPAGWYSLEQLNYCRLYTAQMEGVYDPVKRTVSPAMNAANNKELEREISGGRLGRGVNVLLHHQLVANQLLPALGGILRKGAAAQVAADQAAIACALERYRLAHNQFPDSLDALKPEFMTQIPNDVLSGEPYKYRRTANDQFTLYSVGWNEKDDGGAFWKTLFNEQQGDWVWQSAPQ